jgi:putative protease
VLQLIRQKAPQAVLHLSTQANTTNWRSASFWQEQGFSRINLARETTLQGIQETRKHTSVELEMFVHGALCMAYSGRCLISSIMTGRSANSGECTHPCRWSYALVEESRPGEYYPVEEDANGTLFFNSRDLCLLDYLPSLVAAGVDSLKIEGRMKGVHYLGTTVRVYRQALDRLAQEGSEAFIPDPSWHKELSAVSHRGYTSGFLFGPPRDEAQKYVPTLNRDADFVGIIREIRSDGSAILEVKGPISSGDELEIIGRSPDTHRFTPPILKNDEGAILDRANPNTRLILPPDLPLSSYDLVRRRTISIAT